MTGGSNLPRYGIREEIAHGIIHGVGMILAIVAMAVLMAHLSASGTTRHIVSCGIYGASFIFLYAASTLYHSIRMCCESLTIPQFFCSSLALIRLSHW